MKTKNKTISMLWQGIALVAILVSVIAVGAGASMVYAGDGTMGGGSSTSGGGSTTSGGSINTSGGGSTTSGGSINTSGGVVPASTFIAQITAPDPIIANGVPVNFCVQVTNVTSYLQWESWGMGWYINKSVNDIGRVEILLPDGWTFVDDDGACDFTAVSTNWFYGIGWHVANYNWNVDASNDPLLVAQVPFCGDQPLGDYELQVHEYNYLCCDAPQGAGFGWDWCSDRYEDYVDICFCAAPPDMCSDTGPTTINYTFDATAYYWGEVTCESRGEAGGCPPCPPPPPKCYDWIPDNPLGGCPGDAAELPVTVDVPECPPPPPPPPEEEVPPEVPPEVVPEVPPPLFVPGLGEAPMTPVLSINMEGALARYPVTQDGKLLVNAVTTSPDGMVTLSIPKGCPVLNADSTPAYLNPDPDVFSIAAANLAAPAGATILAAYQLQPAGITFPCDATIIIKYDANMLPAGKVPVIASYDGATGKWTNLETAGYVAGGVEVPNALQAHTGGTLYFAVLAQ